MGKIFTFSKNWTYWGFGLAGCALSGLVTPFFALVYAQVFSVRDFLSFKISFFKFSGIQ
jgi:hypothetical protein